MDENGTLPVNERNFALSLCLLSLIFFGLPFMIILWIILIVLQMWLGSIFPYSLTSILAGFSLPGGLLLLSLTGVIIFIREMKAQSRLWKTGIPLCILFGVIIVFSALYLSPWSGTIQIYLGMISLAGFMSLPYGVAHLLRDFRGTGFDAIQSWSSLTGKLGLIISAVLFLFTLIISSLSVRGLEVVFLTVIFFGIFHILVMMPLVGVKIFRLGISFSKTPPLAAETGRAAEPVPRKKLADILKAIPNSLSPRVKRTILILVILALVVVGCYAYWDMTDTTPGRTWTKVTPSAPFGARTGFTTAEHHGKLWIIGGSQNAGIDGDAWYTSDGITWNRVSSADMVPQRLGASSAVFSDALWITGGSDEQTYTPGNSIWYSGNGYNWSEMQPKTVFPARSWHSTVVFLDRIWVIGGNRGTIHDDLTNDVWYSDDGISWVQATPAAEFSPRSDHSSFVYQDKIWVIGGRDSTGYLNDVWYSGDGVHWTKVPATAPFATDTSFHAVVFDNRIWVLKTSYELKADSLWGRETSQGIWFSYDGITWTLVRGTPEFFRGEYNRGQPLPIVFDNRLFVLQQQGMNTGIWYTKPEGQAS